MGQPSFQDFLAPFDPTAFPQITQAELLQLITGATPNTGFGLPFVTTDVAGVPQVPDATNTAKWQSYIWIRVGATSVTTYVWNPNAVNDGTFQKWQSITLTSIPDGTVTNSKIAPLAVTDDKIAAVAYGKLTGVPTSFVPGGAAGGDLTGNYPNPVIGPNAVDSTKLKSDAAVDANRAITTNHIRNNAIDLSSKILMTGATAKQIVNVKDDLSGLQFLTKLITQLAEPTVTEELKSIRVKADASGFEYVVRPFNAVFVADDGVTLPANDTYSTFAHGLGANPALVQVFIKNVTPELNYLAGDLIPVSMVFRAADFNNPIWFTTDGTNIKTVIASGLTPGANLRVLNKTDPTTVSNITRANWKFHVVATL